MFREMRRKAQQLPFEESVAVLKRGTSGVLAVLGDNDYPYAVPMSYVYDGNRIYFHSAQKGHKLDAIRHSEKASFCVIDQDEVVPQAYTTYFRSVIAFGKLSIVEEEAEKHSAILMLAEKYHPLDSDENRKKAVGQDHSGLCMLKLEIEHMTGKEAVELVKRRK